MSDYRIEKDSLGEVQVPADAYWGAQTQRAIINFPDHRVETLSRFYLVHGHDKARCRGGQPRSGSVQGSPGWRQGRFRR